MRAKLTHISRDHELDAHALKNEPIVPEGNVFEDSKTFQIKKKIRAANANKALTIEGKKGYIPGLKQFDSFRTLDASYNINHSADPALHVIDVYEAAYVQQEIFTIG